MESRVFAGKGAVMELRDDELILVLTGKKKMVLKRSIDPGLSIVKCVAKDSDIWKDMFYFIFLMSDGKLYEWKIFLKNLEDNEQAATDTDSEDDVIPSRSAHPLVTKQDSEDDYYSSADESEDLIKKRRKMTKKDKIPWCITFEEIAQYSHCGSPSVFRLLSGEVMKTNGNGSVSNVNHHRSGSKKSKKADEEIKNYRENYLNPSMGYLEAWFPRIKHKIAKCEEGTSFRLIATGVNDFVHLNQDYLDISIEFLDQPESAGDASSSQPLNRGYYKEIHSDHHIRDARELTMVQGKLFREAEGFLKRKWWRNSPSYIVSLVADPHRIAYKIIFMANGCVVLKHRLIDETGKIRPETISIVSINNMKYIIYQDIAGDYYSVPAHYAHDPQTAKKYRCHLKKLVSLHIGVSWFVLHDKHSFVDIIMDGTENPRDLRSRIKIDGFNKPLCRVCLQENRGDDIVHVMLIDAEDSRMCIKARNVSLINLRALDPNYADHPANTALIRQKCIWSKSTSGFYYQSGKHVMYCPYLFTSKTAPTVVTTLAAGEHLVLSKYPTIHDGFKIWVVTKSEGRIDVSQPPPPSYKLNLGFGYGDEDDDYEEDGDAVTIPISVSPERNFYDALTGLMEVSLMPYHERIETSWTIQILEKSISEGYGVSKECDTMVGREIQERHLVTGRFVHFDRSLLEMSDSKLYVLGKVLRVCSHSNTLPVLPWAFYAGIKYGQWNQGTKNKITDADLYYFAGLADPKRLEILEEMRLDQVKVKDAGFASYREALETFCEMDHDDQYEREINLIVRGYIGNGCDAIVDRNLGSIRALISGRDHIDRSKWNIIYEFEGISKKPSSKKPDTFTQKLKALDEDKLRQLLINWSGSHWLSNGPYEICFVKDNDGIDFMTCTRTIILPIKLFRKQDELIELLIEPTPGFNDL